MSAYSVFEFVVISLIVGASANHVIRKYAPTTHRRVLVWIAARIGVELAAEPAAASGCDSGCGTCATGCGSGDATASKPAASSEQPLHFRPRGS